MASPAPRADGSASLDPTAPLGEDADVNADAPLELNYGSDDDDDGDDDASVDHDAGLGASGTEPSHRTGALMSSYRDFVHALEEGTAGIEGGEAAKAVLEGEAQVREGGGEKAATSAAGGGPRAGGRTRAVPSLGPRRVPSRGTSRPRRGRADGRRGARCAADAVTGDGG